MLCGYENRLSTAVANSRCIVYINFVHLALSRRQPPAPMPRLPTTWRNLLLDFSSSVARITLVSSLWKSHRPARHPRFLHKYYRFLTQDPSVMMRTIPKLLPPSFRAFFASSVHGSQRAREYSLDTRRTCAWRSDFLVRVRIYRPRSPVFFAREEIRGDRFSP